MRAFYLGNVKPGAGAPRGSARALTWLIALLALCGAWVPALAQTDAERALERRVKAAFIYRFTEFVTWPDTAFAKPDAPFVIAVVARDPMTDEVRQTVTGRSVGGRPIEVRRIGEGEAIGAAHLVFIGESEKQRLRDILRTAARHALVVTESDGALAQGSVINFTLADAKVRFEISLESAEKRGLRMSSRLLAVAQNVRASGP